MAQSTAVSGGHTSYDHYIDPRKTWYNNRRIATLNAWIFLMLITSSTNGFDGSMMNAVQSLPRWQSDFGHPTGGKLGLLTAIQTIGALVGLPIAPYMTDGLGRKRAVFFGAMIMVLSAAVQTASQSVTMFLCARVFVGFGLAFTANAAPLLVSEISYPTYRAPLTAMYESLWYSGSVIAGWSTFAAFNITSSWSWRTPSMIQALPSLLQVLLVSFAPESPRWLVSRGRDREALNTLAYYHGDGDENDPLVQFEFNEIKNALADPKKASSSGYGALIATSGNRRRLLIIVAIGFFSQWSGNGLVSYYLKRVLDSIGILLINGILAIWNLFWAVFAALMVERLGRRFLFITSAAGMLLSFLFQTVDSALFQIHGSRPAGHAVIASIFLFFAFYDLAFAPVIVAYTVEILPYPIRAKGFTVLSFVASLGLVLNQYVNPIALEKLHWKYYLVFDCWLVFELIFLYFFIVETRNRTLEETCAVFDEKEPQSGASRLASRNLPAGASQLTLTTPDNDLPLCAQKELNSPTSGASNMSRPHHAPTALSPNAFKLESHGSLIERLDTLSQAIQHRLERPYDNIRREIEVFHSILRNYNLILGVGAFIAGVQTSILAVARTLSPSTVQRATIWFAYVGLTLDVLGTSTGVFRSLILQRAIASADRTRTQLAGDASRTQHHVTILKEKCQRPDQPLPAIEVQGTVDDFLQQARLCEKFEDLYNHTLPASQWYYPLPRSSNHRSSFIRVTRLPLYWDEPFPTSGGFSEDWLIFYLSLPWA
ncbi:hypothetical protein ONZ45_g16725 [Pleurotus djamor]|nr:hypothetical protein ONZ45_g16725 [Pleurotus djamor]